MFQTELKNRDRFPGKLARHFKCKAAGDFSFEAYITGAVKKKIAENTAVKDVLPISNPAIAGFGLKIIQITLNQYIPAKFSYIHLL